MFSTVTLQYLGEPSRQGGRFEIESSIEISVVWDESIKINKFSISQTGSRSRIDSLQADVIATTLFETVDFEHMEPSKIQITRGTKVYDVLEVVPPVADLGLDGTYQLILKERQDR